ncbi:MAG: flagellar hook assembly protein FlgD [Gammaproteobacteria bacterium]|nr:flagellar hook assembly protein FlgD [Gammaproteobacteria bacterium]
MSTIDTNNVWANLGLTQSEEQKKPSNDVGQEQFLKLMMAQMQNQDPMKPMENGDFLTQIAQFSASKGIADMSDSISSLTQSLASNQALQASSLIGRVVLAPSDTGFLEPGQGMGGSVELPSSTLDMNVSIYDQSGAVVKTIPMGQQASGDIYFAWDGTDEAGNTMPPGLYNIQANANINGQNQAMQTMVASRVESVSVGKGGQGVSLNLAGLGSMDFNNVREIM